MAISVLTAGHCVRLTFRSRGKLTNADILQAAINSLAIDYAAEAFDDIPSRVARLQMIDSVLADPSVILQSIRNGEPTIIQDCASEEDLQLLLSQDIENA